MENVYDKFGVCYNEETDENFEECVCGHTEHEGSYPKFHLIFKQLLEKAESLGLYDSSIPHCKRLLWSYVIRMQKSFLVITLTTFLYSGNG